MARNRVPKVVGVCMDCIIQIELHNNKYCPQCGKKIRCFMSENTFEIIKKRMEDLLVKN